MLTMSITRSVTPFFLNRIEISSYIAEGQYANLNPTVNECCKHPSATSYLNLRDGQTAPPVASGAFYTVSPRAPWQVYDAHQNRFLPMLKGMARGSVVTRCPATLIRLAASSPKPSRSINKLITCGSASVCTKTKQKRNPHTHTQTK